MLQTILLAIVVPAILAGIILGAATFRRISTHRQDEQRPASGAWAGGVAVAVGCIVGYVTLLGYPRFPLIDVKQYFPYFAAAACGVGFLEQSVWRASRRPATGTVAGALRWVPRVLLIGAVVGLSLRPLVDYSWSTPVAAAWLVGTAIAFATLWLVMDGLADARSEAGATVACALVGVGSSAVLMLSGSASLGLLAGTLAAVLGMLAFLAALGRSSGVLRCATPVIATVLFTLWLQGYFYSEVPEISAILLLSGLPVSWMILRICRGGRAESGGLLLRLGSVAGPIAAAVLFAWRARPIDDYYY
ncbi:MAG: hypothetical protein IID37_07115 [Planctomycetes bacterium]|nr:hypothetical protein [Planctomycetota bacterium]